MPAFLGTKCNIFHKVVKWFHWIIWKKFHQYWKNALFVQITNHSYRTYQIPNTSLNSPKTTYKTTKYFDITVRHTSIHSTYQ
jgi:hypothetical protein